MINIKRNTPYFVAASLVLLVLYVGIAQAWTNPTQAPPNGGPGTVIPVGSIVAFGGSFAPSGWLLCNGASVSQAAYPALFAVIGTTYGGGSGNFNLPDLRDRALVGASGTKPLGTSGGAPTINIAHSHTVSSHSHPVSIGTTANGNHQHSYSGWTGTLNYPAGRDSYDETNEQAAANLGHIHPYSGWTSWPGDHSHTVSGNTGTAAPGTNSQLSSAQSVQDPYQTGNYIIKY